MGRATGLKHDGGPSVVALEPLSLFFTPPSFFLRASVVSSPQESRRGRKVEEGGGGFGRRLRGGGGGREFESTVSSPFLRLMLRSSLGRLLKGLREGIGQR